MRAVDPPGAGAADGATADGATADEWGMTADERGFTLTIADAGQCGLMLDWAIEPAPAPAAPRAANEVG